MRRPRPGREWRPATSLHPRHRDDRADRDDRVRGRHQHDVRPIDRHEHLRRRTRRVDAVQLDAAHRDLGPVPDPVLLEVDDLVAAVDGRGDVRLDLGVGHRQQRHAGVPASAQLSGHLGERAPLAQAGGADEMGGEVAVAEPEPGLRLAVRRQLLLGVPGLVGASPAAVGVDAAAERVHDRVEVGADPQAEEPDVVGGVRDDGDLVVGPDGVPDAGDESGASEAPGQDGDAHPLIVGSRDRHSPRN